MKNIAVCMLVALILVLGGCSALKPEAVATYPKGSAPSQIIKTEDQWVMLHSTFYGRDYTISVGDNYDSTNNVYSVSDVSIWYFEANENGIAWCEKSEEFYTFKVYSFETQQVETIFQISADEGYQSQNIGIYLDTVYYCYINYDIQEVQVVAYDITTKTTSEVYKVDFDEANQPHLINLEDEYLSFGCSDQVKVLNLQNNEIVFESTLPEAVEHIFSISYDSQNDTCALYYSDNDSEDIGTFKEGDSEIFSVFTFSQNYYAYQDKIECHKGHIYWISQANVTGNISDHYRFVDYNYLEHKTEETERTFNFCRYENELYLLRFNKRGEYTHIDLCQY